MGWLWLLLLVLVLAAVGYWAWSTGRLDGLTNRNQPAAPAPAAPSPTGEAPSIPTSRVSGDIAV
jgi:hypothetical protein